MSKPLHPDATVRGNRVTLHWLLLVTTLVLGFVDSVPAEPWNAWGGNARRFEVAEPLTVQADRIGELWRTELGGGKSGIVCDGVSLFTMYAKPAAGDANRFQEVVVALDPATGRSRWKYEYEVRKLDGQEAFGGHKPGPQATPLVEYGVVLTLGYAGNLNAFDSRTGERLWYYNAVEDFAATPVQFGFSSSPLPYQGKFVVLLGGSRGGLVALDPTTGKVQWKLPCGEASYACPVLIQLGGEDQVVFVTRDYIAGVAAKSGQARWKYPLPEQGLTNVPTPVWLPDNQLLIAGQGTQGVRLLKLRPAPGAETKVDEVWHNKRIKPFYCNMVVRGDYVFVCAENITHCLRWADGQSCWLKRGYANSNAILTPGADLILRGNGTLAVAKLSEEGIDAVAGTKVFDSRCWTAPTLVSGTLFARNETEVTAIRLAAPAAADE